MKRRLNEDQARDAIEKYFHRGFSLGKIAEDLGVSKTCVKAIMDGKTFKHLERPKEKGYSNADKLPKDDLDALNQLIDHFKRDLTGGWYDTAHYKHSAAVFSGDDVRKFFCIGKDAARDLLKRFMVMGWVWTGVQRVDGSQRLCYMFVDEIGNHKRLLKELEPKDAKEDDI